MNETAILRLELRDFRNFKAVELRPAVDGLTVIQGENGAGKSSLLEAIVYSSTLQSFRGAPREAIVRQGTAEANVRCDVLAGKRKVEVEVEVVPGRRDRAWHNGQRVPGTRGLLEVLRTTLFTPDDLALVKGSPSGRRDFVDDVLAKSRPRLGADRSGLGSIQKRRPLSTSGTTVWHSSGSAWLTPAPGWWRRCRPTPLKRSPSLLPKPVVSVCVMSVPGRGHWAKP